MAKINRYNGNLQAPASAALGTERTIFGEVTQSDDLTDQFTADLLRGWGIVGPSDQPTLQDFNAVAFTLGQLHAYLHQMGVAEWNASQEYHIGSLATVNGLLFSSLTNNNTGNDPSSSVANWQPEGAGSTSVTMTGSNVTLTPLQAARSVIIITGTLTANVQLIFPTYVKAWQIINQATGNFYVTCKTAAGTGVSVPAGNSTQVVGDGTSIIVPIPAATQTEVDAGTLDNVAVTPKKLRWGVQFSAGANGYLILPSWLGGFILQWGATPNLNASSFTVVTLPIAFPSVKYAVLATHQGTTIDAYAIKSRSDSNLGSVAFLASSGSPPAYFLAIGR